jgi:hypothetical protein
VWNKYPFRARCLVALLWCVASASLGFGAMSCISNPTPHPADEDQGFDMAPSGAGATAGSAEAERGFAADAAAGTPMASEGDVVNSADAMADVGPDAADDVPSDAANDGTADCISMSCDTEGDVTNASEGEDDVAGVDADADEVER